MSHFVREVQDGRPRPCRWGSRTHKTGFMENSLLLGYLCVLSAFVSPTFVDTFVNAVNQMAGHF